MATVTKKNARHLPSPGFGAHFGNRAGLEYQFKTNSSGVMADSDQASAIVEDDKVILGVLPSGMRLFDFVGVISDAFTALTVFDLGFEYIDGVDDSDVPEDSDYFADGAATSSLAVLRKTTTTAPITLPKAAYLILTNMTGADHASAGQMDILIDGILTGA